MVETVNVYFTKPDDGSKEALKNLAFSSNAYANGKETKFRMHTDPGKLGEKDMADIKPTGEYVVVKDKTIMEMEELAPGAEDSEKVKILQGALQMQGYEDLVVDGDYGPATEKAVKQFQESQKALKLPVTGKADKKTWEALGQFKIQKALVEQYFKTWYPTGTDKPFNTALNTDIKAAKPDGTITPKKIDEAKDKGTAPVVVIAEDGKALTPKKGEIVQIKDIADAATYKTEIAKLTFVRTKGDLEITFDTKKYILKGVFDANDTETDIAKVKPSDTAPSSIRFADGADIPFADFLAKKTT